MAANYSLFSAKFFNSAKTFFAKLTASPTANRTIVIPDASGTMALTSDFAQLNNFSISVNSASPNNTIYAVQLLAAAGSTNADLILSSKGTGAISVHVPDGTSTGGNKRGTNSVDFQATRTAASQVASGSRSIVLNGGANIGSGTYSITGGNDCVASGAYTLAVGNQCTSSGSPSVSFGTFGSSAVANKLAIGTTNSISVRGASQTGLLTLAVFTTNATPAALVTNNAAASTTNQIVLANNQSLSFRGIVTARQQAAGGTKSAMFEIKGHARREASAATTTLLYSEVLAVYNPDGLTVALSADTTNGAIAITVTGLVATNIIWVASVWSSESIYA